MRPDPPVAKIARAIAEGARRALAVHPLIGPPSAGLERNRRREHEVGPAPAGAGRNVGGVRIDHRRAARPSACRVHPRAHSPVTPGSPRLLPPPQLQRRRTAHAERARSHDRRGSRSPTRRIRCPVQSIDRAGRFCRRRDRVPGRRRSPCPGTELPVEPRALRPGRHLPPRPLRRWALSRVPPDSTSPSSPSSGSSRS